MVVGLLGNKSPDSNRLTLVTPKSENDVRLQATLGNQNPTGLPVGAVSAQTLKSFPQSRLIRSCAIPNGNPIFPKKIMQNRKTVRQV